MNSNAAAKRRRAIVTNNPVQTPSATNLDANSGKLKVTIPQIIGVIEKRLLSLEDTVNKNLKKENSVETSQSNNSEIKEILDEYESRFDMLAGEIQDIKDIMLKLQAFTMEVNKKLFENLDMNNLGTLESIVETNEEEHSVDAEGIAVTFSGSD